MLPELFAAGVGVVMAIIASLVPGVGTVHAILVTLAIVGQGNPYAALAAVVCWATCTILMSSKEALFPSASGNVHAIAALWSMRPGASKLVTTLIKSKMVAILIALVLEVARLPMPALSMFAVAIACFKLSRGRGRNALAILFVLGCVTASMFLMVQANIANPLFIISLLVFLPNPKTVEEGPDEDNPAEHEHAVDRDATLIGSVMAILSSNIPGLSINLVINSYQGQSNSRLATTLAAQAFQEALTIRWAFLGLSGGKTIVGQILSNFTGWEATFPPIAVIVCACAVGFALLPILYKIHSGIRPANAATVALFVHVATVVILIGSVDQAMAFQVGLMLLPLALLMAAMDKFNVPKDVLAIAFTAPLILSAF
jgi:hypothetical protein